MAVYASAVYKSLFLTQVQQDLESSAVLLENRFKPYLLNGDAQAIDALCKKTGQESRIRLTVIDRAGHVLGDSESAPASMDNHANRSEFMDALSGQVGSSERLSQTVQRNMMYVAIPIRLGNDNQVTHSLRASISTELIYQGQRSFYLKLLLPTFLIALLAATSSWYLSRRIARPLIQMRDGANRFSEGHLDTPLESPDSEEMSSLAQALNQMARQLNQRIQVTLEQRKELETILASMAEGVIAVDRDTRVLNINKAAAELLDIRSADTQDRLLIEIGRNHELIQLVDDTLATQSREEAKIHLSPTNERTLTASATPVFNIEGQITGAVVVLSDVTKQAKLETMRKDFVANVSHELKTPITSIKGATGNPLAAGGALQIAATSLTIKNSLIPSTINHKIQDPDCDLDYVSGIPRKSNIKYALINSHGIGKVNSCLILKRIDL